VARRAHRLNRMSLMHARLVSVALGALALGSAGCFAPWSPLGRNGEIAHGTSSHTNSPPGTASPVLHSDPTASQPDLAAVLDKLQQVREIDPAAEQRLRNQLRQTPPASWPLVAEQFRASLAYREHVAGKEARTTPNQVAAQRPAAGIGPVGYDDIGSPTALIEQQKLLAESDHPSTPIGTLPDPRAAITEHTIVARTTPYSMPGPLADNLTLPAAEPNVPAAFADDGHAEEIATAKGESQSTKAQEVTQGGTSPAVKQARFETTVQKTKDHRGVKKANEVVTPESRPDDDKEDWQQLVKRAADDLGDRVASAPTTTAEVHQHVSLRMLRLLAGDTEKAVEPIPHITPTEQDYWSRQLFALATYLDHHSQPDDKRRAAASVTQLDEAVSHLRELGSLSLHNLSFCKSVYGYGAIEPYDKDKFSPGQQVTLYVEVENYHSSSTEKGYCTSLGSTYEVLDKSGERVMSGEFPDVDDCCRSRRRDFHIQYGLTLPAKLAAGTYKLQLVVKDRQSDKMGTATASFEIAGSTSTK
jgi:hypothetical protein